MSKKFNVGLIRVLTSDDPKFVNMHGQFIMDHFPGLHVESKCIPDQWEGIHSPELCRQAVPKIVQLAKDSFSDKDMIIVSCADDPGVDAIRSELPNIPVTGGGETTCALAYRYSEHVGILGITDYPPAAYTRMLGDRLVINKRPQGIHSTLDLMTLEGHDATLMAAREIKAAGAGVIALGCTGLTTIGITSEIEKEVGIPVIDPVLAEGLFAFYESIRK